MDERGSKKDKTMLIGIPVIMLVILAFFAMFFQAALNPAATSEAGLGELKVVSTVTIGAIKQLNVCGNWPIGMVNASVSRGNPFNRKSAALPVMAATSSPQCLPAQPVQ